MPETPFARHRELGRTGSVVSRMGIGDLTDRGVPVEQRLFLAGREIPHLDHLARREAGKDALVGVPDFGGDLPGLVAEPQRHKLAVVLGRAQLGLENEEPPGNHRLWADLLDEHRATPSCC